MPVTALDEVPGSLSHRWPQFLADGRHFIFYALSNSPSVNGGALSGGTYVGSLDGGKPKLLLRGDTNAVYAAPDHLLFARNGVLMAQQFDPARLALHGDPIAIANSVRIIPAAWYVMASASQNGILAYAAGTGPGGWRMEWFDRNGKAMGSVGGTQFFHEPRLSPDGKELAAVISRVPATQANIWVFDLAKGTARRVTFGSSEPLTVIWSPDGKTLAFSAYRAGSTQVYEKPVNGTGATQLLFKDGAPNKHPISWSSDGRYITIERVDPQGKTGWDVWILPLFGDRKPFPFLNGAANEYDTSFSPDGKWVAYVSDETGRAEVYIVPFPKRSGKWQVSMEGGSHPHWRRDGKEFYYLSRDNKLMAVKIQERNTALEIGNPQPLFQTNPPTSLYAGWIYDVTADGKKFIVDTQPPSSPSSDSITLVTNWPALLNKQ